MSMMELATSLAPISYNALTDFVSQVVEVRPLSAATAFLLAVSQQRRRISPIGRLHLERVEMYSAGVQKGELVFTVPMAPMETISIPRSDASFGSASLAARANGSRRSNAFPTIWRALNEQHTPVLRSSLNCPIDR